MHSAKEALSVEGMASAQCHDHHPREGNPRTWQEEGEFPARFVWQMAVAISCEAANKFQLRLRVPRSPALQPMIGGDRSWWTPLPASAASELTMAPIGLQLMLCLPRDEGHISPVIYGTILHHLSKRSACCGIRTAERWQSKAAFLNPFEDDKRRGSCNPEIHNCMVTHDIYRTTRVCELAGWPRSGNKQHCQEASATHASWQPWLRTTSRRRTLAWDQFSEISTHINPIPHAEPAPRTQKVQECEGTQLSRSRSRSIGQPSRK